VTEPKYVASPRKEYRFKIKPDDWYGLPEVSLEHKGEGRWARWVRVDYYTFSAAWRESDVDIEKTVESLMKRLWDENVQRENFNMQLKDYWDNPHVHLNFDVRVAIESGSAG
jgi:hypothetical protein